MVDAAVTFLLDQLSTLIREENSLLGEIREDAEDIKNALDHVQSSLRVADEMEEIDPQVKAWVKIVRELAYDAEDVLDEFMFRFGGRRRTGEGFFTKIQKIYSSAQDLRDRQRLAGELRRIKARVNDTSLKEHKGFLTSFANTAVHSYNKAGWYDSRGDALLLEESDLVGIENSKQSLVNLLLGAVDDDLKVHSVVGMGGLGKTTLVKKAYDDAQVMQHFQLHVWLTASETVVKIEELLKDAIRQLVKQTTHELPPDFEAMNSTRLKEFTRNILLGQRYIIVVDDVWDNNAWMAIKYAFPRQSFSSCIVITTRNSEIGASASHETHGNVWSLEPLSKEDSWTLFCRKTFLGCSCPRHLVNISKNILKRCDGLPLAIVVIAGVLATKNKDIEEWKRFQQSLNIQLETNDRMKNMKYLLSLSYYDLPYYLKYCFLYLSVFPEDVIISKNKVIRLWIAEGFVRENSQQVKEEVAEAYLNELLHRNLIQIVGNTRGEKMSGFRVHGILREIILSKSIEQNFAIIASGQNTKPSKFRRLTINKFDNHILRSTSSKMNLRSFLFFEPVSSSMASLSLSKLLATNFIPLKVLDLRCARLEEIPEEVFNLFQLKYLSLRETMLKRVSKSIGRLQNLETLDLKHTSVTMLPAELLKLCELRHLLLYRYGEWNDPWSTIQSFSAPFEIGELLSLQKLCFIQANDTGNIKIVSEIGKLTQLRRLAISNLKQEDAKELCLSLEKLTNLCSLSLASASEDEIIDIQLPPYAIPCLRSLYLGGCLWRVPQWLSSLEGLTRLNLVWNRLPEDPLPFIQDLPMLAYLELYKCYETEGLCFKAQKFSKLKIMFIRGFEALKWIRIEEGALDNLEELRFSECKILEQVPLGIQHLSNLKEISFYLMADQLIASVEPRGENYAKISHIPNIMYTKFIDGEGTCFLNGQEL